MVRLDDAALFETFVCYPVIGPEKASVHLNTNFQMYLRARRHMDTDHIREALPHYLAILVLVAVVITVLREFVAGLSFWIELVIVMILVFVYQAVVLWLGVAPSRWER